MSYEYVVETLDGEPTLYLMNRSYCQIRWKHHHSDLPAEISLHKSFSISDKDTKVNIRMTGFWASGVSEDITILNVPEEMSHDIMDDSKWYITGNAVGIIVSCKGNPITPTPHWIKASFCLACYPRSGVKQAKPSKVVVME